MCKKVLRYASTTQNTTTQPHNHTTTNMRRCRPTLQRLWPSPSMGRAAAPLNHGAARPAGLRSLSLVCSFGASQRNPLNNREGGGVLALGGRRLVGKPNNQPKVGGSGRGDVRAEARWAWSAGGDVIVSFRMSNRTMKKQK